jgi:dTDP-4-dehydrorhamnose reductase
LIGLAPADVSVFAPTSAELDISDPRSVDRAFSRIHPDLVINSAAFTAVDRAELERDRAFAVNSDGAANIARACAAAAVPLIHLSTDYVFDGSKRTPYVEDDATAPLNVYGASKLAGERGISECDGHYRILRVSWVFSATGTNFVKTMLGLAGREELRVVNDQSGTPCAADDIAECIWLISRTWDSAQRGIFHFSSAPETTWYQFAKAIFSGAYSTGIIAHAPTVVPIPSSEYPQRATRPGYSMLDSTRLFDTFGVKPRDWTESLAKVMAQLADRRR